MSPRLRKCILLALLVLAAPPRVEAQIHDDFDGTTLDGSFWGLIAADGSATVSGGLLTLTGGTQFPIVYALTNPFPATGDFELRVRARYLQQAFCGHGIYAAAHPDFGYGARLYYDSLGLRALVGDVWPVNIAGSATAFHVYEWIVTGTTYSFYVDGNLVTTDDSAYRPLGLWIGQVQPVGGCFSSFWGGMQIDYIYAEPHGAIPTESSTWGRVKALY
jgi:hypothetical protein